MNEGLTQINFIHNSINRKIDKSSSGQTQYHINNTAVTDK